MKVLRSTIYLRKALYCPAAKIPLLGMTRRGVRVLNISDTLITNDQKRKTCISFSKKFTIVFAFHRSVGKFPDCRINSDLFESMFVKQYALHFKCCMNQQFDKTYEL